MKKMKVGIVGLGPRGRVFVRIIHSMDDIEITAVCDIFEERLNEIKQYLVDNGHAVPFVTKDYKELLKRDIDAVLIAASWEAHVPIAVDAMKAGIPTGLEVGGAYSVEDCYKLVNTYEATKTPFMFLANCCFGKEELMITKMVREGVFGEICYCHGAYAHDLRPQISMGLTSKHYRLRNYLRRNCDNYPIHDLGPIARLLNINRGNRLISLTSVASKSRGMHEYVKNKKEFESLAEQNFAQGDIVFTSIKCIDGTLITLKLDTTLPRAYSREFSVHGTKAMYSEQGNILLVDGTDFDHEQSINKQICTAKKYEERYLPKVWKDLLATERTKSGHGGIDYLTLNAFFSAVTDKKPMPIDAYDAASWMVISALTEQSIAMGGMPVAIPDFTGGEWLIRKPFDVVEL